MDKIDIAILREILDTGRSNLPNEGPRKSFRSLARRLAVDENTIRRRMRKHLDSGFVRRWTLALNPQLLGLNEAQVWVDFDDKTAPKKDVLEKVALIQGVVSLKEFLGPSFSATIQYQRPEELTRTVSLVSKIAASSEEILLANISYPECPVVLSPTDWRIVEVLQKNAWMHYNELSKLLGISVRTTRRRFRRLVDNQAVFMRVMIDATALEGVLMANLIVLYSEPDGRDRVNGEIFSRIGDRILRTELNVQNAYFCFEAKKVGDIEGLSEFLGSMKGVKNYRIRLVSRITDTGVYIQPARRAGFPGSSIARPSMTVKRDA